MVYPTAAQLTQISATSKRGAISLKEHAAAGSTYNIATQWASTKHVHQTLCAPTSTRPLSRAHWANCQIEKNDPNTRQYPSSRLFRLTPALPIPEEKTNPKKWPEEGIFFPILFFLEIWGRDIFSHPQPILRPSSFSLKLRPEEMTNPKDKRGVAKEAEEAKDLQIFI